MARRSKICEEITAKLVEAFSVGATHRIACQYAGISHEAFYQWLDKGAAGIVPYVEFVERIKESQGREAVGNLAKITKAASDGTWQAAAWLLERRFPQEYGRTVQEQHTVDWNSLTDAQLERLAAGESLYSVMKREP